MHRFTAPVMIAVLMAVLVSPVVAHEGHQHPEDAQEQGMVDDCLDNRHCQTATGMIGYDWFGTGSYGFLFGIVFWALLIADIIYLFRKIPEQS